MYLSGMQAVGESRKLYFLRFERRSVQGSDCRMRVAIGRLTHGTLDFDDLDRQDLIRITSRPSSRPSLWPLSSRTRICDFSTAAWSFAHTGCATPSGEDFITVCSRMLQNTIHGMS